MGYELGSSGVGLVRCNVWKFMCDVGDDDDEFE